MNPVVRSTLTINDPVANRIPLFNEAGITRFLLLLNIFKFEDLYFLISTMGSSFEKSFMTIISKFFYQYFVFAKILNIYLYTFLNCKQE